MGLVKTRFYSGGKVNDLKYVLMGLARFDEKWINYSAIEKIKNGYFDTCKYNNENVCGGSIFLPFSLVSNYVAGHCHLIYGVYYI